MNTTPPILPPRFFVPDAQNYEVFLDSPKPDSRWKMLVDTVVPSPFRESAEPKIRAAFNVLIGGCTAFSPFVEFTKSKIPGLQNWHDDYPNQMNKHSEYEATPDASYDIRPVVLMPNFSDIFFGVSAAFLLGMLAANASRFFLKGASLLNQPLFRSQIWGAVLPAPINRERFEVPQFEESREQAKQFYELAKQAWQDGRLLDFSLSARLNDAEYKSQICDLVQLETSFVSFANRQFPKTPAQLKKTWDRFAKKFPDEFKDLDYDALSGADRNSILLMQLVWQFLFGSVFSTLFKHIPKYSEGAEIEKILRTGIYDCNTMTTLALQLCRRYELAHPKIQFTPFQIYSFYLHVEASILTGQGFVNWHPDLDMYNLSKFTSNATFQASNGTFQPPEAVAIFNYLEAKTKANPKYLDFWIETLPGEINALILLIYRCIGENDQTQFAKYFDQLRQLYPTHPWCHFAYGHYYVTQNDFDRAREHLKDFLRMTDGKPNIRGDWIVFYLTSVLEKIDAPELMIQLLEPALNQLKSTSRNLFVNRILISQFVKTNKQAELLTLVRSQLNDKKLQKWARNYWHLVACLVVEFDKAERNQYIRQLKKIYPVVSPYFEKSEDDAYRSYNRVIKFAKSPFEKHLLNLLLKTKFPNWKFESESRPYSSRQRVVAHVFNAVLMLIVPDAELPKFIKRDE